MTSSGGHRPDLDGLRAVAVVPVVLFHAGLPVVPGGFVGVDVFFVLSGYLITRLIRTELEAGSFSLARFYERRARRILPALFVVIASCLVAGWFRLLPRGFEDLAGSAIAALFSISNIWAWQEAGDYFGTAAELTPLLHTWSLGVEEQFYIAFPVLVLALWRWQRKSVVPAIIVLTLASFAVSTAASSQSPSAAFFLTPSRAWELGIGALLAFAPVAAGAQPWRREVMAIGGLAAIAAAVLTFDANTTFPGFAAALPCLGAAAVIHAGIGGPSRVSRVLSARPLVFIGLISYSLYLWHWPLLAFTREQLGTLDLPFSTAALAVSAAVVLAAISWVLVETPIRRRRSRRPAGPLLFGFLAAGGLAAVAATVVVGDGIPSRLSPELRALLERAPVMRAPDGGACMERTPEEGLCRIGLEGAAPTFLLWGDSHALALAPAIDVAAATVGEAGLLASSSACPALLGVLYPGNGRCDPMRAAVMDEIRLRPELRTIILVSRWALWQTNLDPFEGPRPDDHRQFDDPALPGEPGEQGVVAFGLVQLVDALRAMNREVVIVATAPEFPFDVSAAVLAHARFGRPMPPGPDIEDYAERNAGVMAVLAELDALEGVRIVPLADFLCRPECLAAFNGRPIYRDDDHFSYYAARTLLGPLMAERIWSTP